MADPIRVDTSVSPPEIFVYDEIGPAWMGMTDDAQVIAGLDSLGDPEEFVVRINSPGGDVHIGNSIHNAITRHPARVIVEIDGLAASAASIIAMAGDEIRMFPNSMMMIHRAWTISLGNADDFEATAEVLRKVDAGLVETYSARTGVEPEAIEGMLAAETWMTASEAVEASFAHRVIEPDMQIAACVIPEQFPFRNIPKNLAKYVAQRDYSKREVRGFPERDVESFPRLSETIDRVNARRNNHK